MTIHEIKIHRQSDVIVLTNIVPIDQKNTRDFDESLVHTFIQFCITSFKIYTEGSLKSHINTMQ